MYLAWVTYLEMKRRPLSIMAGPSDPAIHIAREQPGPAEYLVLFRLVGDRFDWDLRTRMSPPDLASHLNSADTLLFVLRVDGAALGFCEFEKRPDGDMQLMFCGIAAAIEGRRLGRRLLLTSLDRAWAEQPNRIWLHTDTEDSPKALPLYLSLGFEQFDRRYEDVTDF
jgi:ribosomal protein S18 acetylase RimI-like enzyme